MKQKRYRFYKGKEGQLTETVGTEKAEKLLM